jgi:hypothetical protein
MAIHRNLSPIAVAVATALLLAPSALARPIDSVPKPSSSSPVVVTQPAGFSWADAAVGAGLALSISTLVLAVILLVRRSHLAATTVRSAR